MISISDGSTPVFIFTIFVAFCNGFPHFQRRIPNGYSVPNPCPNEIVYGTVWSGVGHRARAGTGPRNPFGLDWAKNNFIWDECICRHDSDGDGRSNGEELGDPDCIWTPGASPTVSVNLTHPGICEPLDSLECQEKNLWLDCNSMIPIECAAFQNPDTRSLDFAIDRTRIPAVESTYHCKAYNLPTAIATGDFHMIGVETIIGNVELLHHVDLYGCPDETAADANNLYGTGTDCGGMVQSYCKEKLYVWSGSSNPDCFDPEFGVRLGRQGIKTVVVELHWNNPQRKRRQWDTSGVRIHFTQQLRPYDTQTIYVGPYYLELPPGQLAVTQASQCSSECTNYMFAEPVYISSIFPHMHLIGKGMLVQQIRNGVVIRTLLDDQSFDYNFPTVQRYRPHVQFLPGDELKVVCTFDTTSRDGFTFFGDATNDEMCMATVQIYPKQTKATDCWGANTIGFCDIETGVEALQPCYTKYNNFVTQRAWLRFIDDIKKAFNLLKANCDVTGKTCKPGCKAVVDQIKLNECFSDDVDEYFKGEFLPYIIEDTNQLNNMNRFAFIQAIASCDYTTTGGGDSGLCPAQP